MKHDESRLIDEARREAEAVPCDAGPRPDLIPGYTVLSEIHRGAQGVVYEAVRESTGKRVAIKVMREGPHAGEMNRARFEREIAVLAQMRHPNIVSVHDSGSSAGSFYFVMDLIEGWPLDEYVERHELSVKASLRLFADIARAVNAAHLHGVIHRDIKPGNIRIDEDGQPHVLDFGLAKLEDGEPSTMTTTGQFIGTLPWSAPEQSDGSASLVDVRTDVYALGVILFEMLTGRLPYDLDGGPLEAMERIRSSDPIRPRKLRPEIDDEVETIVLTCLAKEPERRYQTAGELARDVLDYLDGYPIAAKRDSSWYVFSKHLRRHRVAVAVAACFLLVITAGFVTSFTFWRQAEALRASAVQDAQVAERFNRFYEEAFIDLDPWTMEGAPGVVVPAIGRRESAAPRARADEVSVAQLLRGMSEDIAIEFGDQPEMAARAHARIGSHFAAVGLWEDASEELHVVLDERRARLGDDDPDTLRTAVQLGEALSYSGEHEEAARTLEPLVMRLDQEFGPREQETLRARKALGYSLSSQGKVEEGLRLQLEAHDLLAQELGDSHALVIQSAVGAAYWLGESGQVVQAEALIRPHASAAVRVFGPEHEISNSANRTLERLLIRRRTTDSSLEGAPGSGEPAPAPHPDALGDVEELMRELPELLIRAYDEGEEPLDGAPIVGEDGNSVMAVLEDGLTVFTTTTFSQGAGALSAEDIAEHRAMSQEFLDRVHAGDWQGLAEMYEEDAVVLQMHTEPLVGREAIRDFWAAFPPVAELRFEDDGIRGAGDLAYVHGRYWVTFDLPGSPTDEGNYLDVRRRQPDGSWKYVAECSNTSRPAEEADRH
ncbi:MAG: protein kinase domain-containing protein [Planctomycetota bacterium]|jgi:ketosteroid isomerase-like protein/tRNA A-37 threonylcarbamoyl transferase component Bud32